MARYDESEGSDDEEYNACNICEKSTSSTSNPLLSCDGPGCYKPFHLGTDWNPK